MFWNKKEEKDSLPDLPPIKSQFKPAFNVPRQQIPLEHDDSDSADDVESHGLPSFPDSPMQRGFSQSAIKDAISQDQISEENPDTAPMPPQPMKTVELDSAPIVPLSALSQPRVQQQQFMLDEPPARADYSLPRKPSAPKANEIFVKVERFNTAYKSITSISKKVDEIDSALRKIREIKMREEQELTAWEKELSALKARLQDINSNLFE